jgi:hypothetical protein
MSQMTATARPLRAPRRGPAPVASLKVLPARMASTGSGAFATLCIVLLTAGLIALLVLNTAVAQGSIGLAQLQRDSARLTDTAGNLQEQIDRSSASGALARSAAQLGMVRMSERGYIDLAAGTVTGAPKPATKDLALPIVTSPTPLAVTKEVKGLLSSASSVATKAQTSAQQAAAKKAAAAAKAAEARKRAAAAAAATPTAPGAAAKPGVTTTLGTGGATGQPTSATQPTQPTATATQPTPTPTR